MSYYTELAKGWHDVHFTMSKHIHQLTAPDGSKWCMSTLLSHGCDGTQNIVGRANVWAIIRDFSVVHESFSIKGNKITFEYPREVRDNDAVSCHLHGTDVVVVRRNRDGNVTKAYNRMLRIPRRLIIDDDAFRDILRDTIEYNWINQRNVILDKLNDENITNLVLSLGTEKSGKLFVKVVEEHHGLLSVADTNYVRFNVDVIKEPFREELYRKFPK